MKQSIQPAPTASPDSRSFTPERRRIVVATIVGTTIEWYDFFIYAFAAGSVFAPLFFAPAGGNFAVLLSLFTIGLSFLFRPLGAFLAGHFGDRIGRRPMLVITLLLMGGATTLIGVLPGFAQIGFAAPICLILLRIIQGISAGGEWGGAVLMSVENAPAGRRGLFGTFPQMGVPLGMLSASAMLALMQFIAPGPAFLAWGWRIPFLVSIVLVGFGYVVRKSVQESPVFRELQLTARRQSAPISVLFRKYGRLVVLSALLFAGNNAVGYMVTGGYIQGWSSRAVKEGGLGFTPVVVQLAILVAAVVWLASTLASGLLADSIGRKKTFFIGWTFTAAAVIPLFELVKSGELGLLIGACLVAIGLGLTYGPQAVWYAESFPASVRYSGVSISYALGAILGGAFAPMIAQALMQSFGSSWAIVVYLMVMIIIGTVATAVLRERRDVPLDITSERSGVWQNWGPENGGSPRTEEADVAGKR